jgi:hypothetical protein
MEEVFKSLPGLVTAIAALIAAIESWRARRRADLAIKVAEKIPQKVVSKLYSNGKDSKSKDGPISPTLFKPDE